MKMNAVANSGAVIILSLYKNFQELLHGSRSSQWF